MDKFKFKGLAEILHLNTRKEGPDDDKVLAADVRTGEIRRFLTGPAGCEITGATGTPDGKTMFINVQHPGESPSERSDASQPTRFSTWPDGAGAARPLRAHCPAGRAAAAGGRSRPSRPGSAPAAW